MPDQISQDLGFNASQALKTLQELDGSLGRLESRLASTTGTLAKFNQTAGTDKALKSLAQFGNVGPRAMDQLANSTRRSSATIRGAFDDWISLSGKYTTSLQLLSRITFTQVAIKGLRLTEQAFQDAIKASIDFQKQLAEIRSIDTDKIFGADLGDRLRGLASDFNLALPDVAKGTYEALSAQVLKSGNDFQFMTAAAEFAKGSLTSLEASVNVGAGALNAYGKSAADANRLFSEFQETIRLGTIRGEELAAQFGTVATLGNQLGVSTAELNAAIATLTVRGLSASTATTQLRGVLVGLTKPSEALAKALREMGFASAEEAIQARTLGGLLRDLQARTDGTAQAAGELFHNQRALSGALAIGGQGAQQYADNLEKIRGVASTLNKERAQQVMASDAEQLTKKFNTLKTSLIPLGDAFVTMANKGLEGLGVLRDYSVATLQFTGDLLRGKPAIDQFGDAWLNLQALFGKDITIGESGGKIVSELEIRQRQLDIIAKRREEETTAQLQQQANANAKLNELRFREIDNARAANKILQTEAQSAADRLLAIEKNKIAELTRQIQQSEQLVRDSQSRISDLNTRLEDRQFRTKIAGLSDPQQALALLQRSQALASQAAQTMQQAARSGNQLAIQRARSLFDAASATADEARSVAQSAGARDRELQAGRALEDITRQQIAAEQNLARTTEQRLPQLDQQRAKQQASLDLITKATAELIKNSSLFDKEGKQVTGDEAAQRAEARARALKTLVEQGIPKEKVVDLQFKTEGALQTLAQQLQAKLNSIDATPFQTAEISIRGSVQSANEIANAFERAASAAGQLNVPTPPANRAFGGAMNYLAAGGRPRGVDSIPAMLSPGEFVVNSKATGKFFSQLQAMNAGQAPVFREAGGSVNHGIIGDVSVSVAAGSGPAQTARSILAGLKREVLRRGGAL